MKWLDSLRRGAGPRFQVSCSAFRGETAAAAAVARPLHRTGAGLAYITGMPNRKSPTPARPARGSAAVADGPPPASLRDIADALYRAARESCRQHARYSCVLERETLAVEQLAAAEAVELTDQLLESIVDKYERTASELPRSAGKEWWHQANILWLASREWLRHREAGDGNSRTTRRHGVDELEVLHVGFALEASAILALRQAADAYSRARPDAELKPAPIRS